jgi:Ca-activated chloride channel homolog
MKRLVVLLVIVFSLFSIAMAQSGRRVKTATPTATPSVIAEQSQEPEYSETAPSKPRPVFASESQKENKNKSKNKNEKQIQNKTLPPSTTDQATTASADDDGEVLKIETNLVTIPVSVFDRNGIYIPNLQQSDFKIFEDGVEQEVAYFGTADKPFTVVLLIDVSPSTAYKIEEIQEAAIAFVDQLKPQDNVLVIQFDSGVDVLTELTNDRQKIHKAIRRTGFGDGTSLYEAVRFSLRKRLNKIEGRKAVVLFTDGVDTTSTGASFENTIAEAEESDSIIFPIYYNTFLDMTGIGRGGVMSTPPTLGLPPGLGGMGGIGRGSLGEEYKRGRAYLETLADVTGGRVFRPESTPGGLESAFEGIAEELRRQYSIGYYPQGEGQPGQRKQIKVRVNRAKLIVRSRDSYIVGNAAPKTQGSK